MHTQNEHQDQSFQQGGSLFAMVLLVWMALVYLGLGALGAWLFLC